MCYFAKQTDIMLLKSERFRDRRNILIYHHQQPEGSAVNNSCNEAFHLALMTRGYLMAVMKPTVSCTFVAKESRMCCGCNLHVKISLHVFICVSAAFI